MELNRQKVKSFIEHVLVDTGAYRICNVIRSGHRVILAYHNVVPTGDEVGGEYSLHIAEERLSDHFNALRKRCSILPLKKVLIRESQSSPVVAITFDDAYRGTVTAGVRAALAHDVPVTIFVPPGLLGGNVFWWDILAGSDGIVEEVARKKALSQGRGETDKVMESTRDGNIQLDADSLPWHTRSATVEELDSAVANDGISVGSHSWSHANLTRCSKAQLTRQLKRSSSWLQNRYGKSYIPCLSYPYGLYDSRVSKQARRWYEWAVKIDGGGWNNATDVSPYSLPRINIARDVSRRGLLLRTVGVVPISP